MASWMIHLRIADALLDKIDGIDRTAFVVGSIAPDSGVPNADETAFTPPKAVTHYMEQADGEVKRIDLDAFCADYFSPEKIASYSPKTYSFFLGYYVHLLTDIAWSEKISQPTKKQHSAEYAEDRATFVKNMKADWYDLDFRFLREHPDFRSFGLYEQAKGFRNDYMKEFSADAFDGRREFICGFYRGEEHGDLYREYLYLTPAQTDRFVREATEEILHKIS